MRVCERLRAWAQAVKDRAWALWLKAAGVRALKTVAQTLIANIGVTAAMSRGDWLTALSAAAMAGIVSLAMSFVSLPEASDGADSERTWAKSAVVRCLRTIGQSVAANLAAFTLLSQVNWTSVLSAALIAGALSLVTSTAGLPETSDTGA